ncbi:MFS transporter [Lactococcus laudensis]|uniref:MFS transporter n=1 Tax=Pseudolactococcus laudensis TaxID=1494461 RepID=UPI002FCA5A4A
MLKKLWQQFYLSANLVTFTQISFRLIIVLYASSLLTDAKAIGTMMIFDTLPFLILGPVIAKIVNHHNRKNLLKLTVFLDFLLTLVLLVIMRINYQSLVAFALLLAINNVVTSTYQIAESSFFPLILDNMRLAKYNSAIFFSGSLAMIIAPNISGLIQQTGLISLLVVVSTGIFLLAFINLFFVAEVADDHATENRGMASSYSLFRSFTYIFEDKKLLLALVLLALGNLFDAPMDTLMITKYTEMAQLTKVGLIFSMAGISSLVGSFLLSSFSNNKMYFQRMMFFSGIGIAFSGVLLFLNDYLLYLVATFILSCSMSIRTIYIITFRQVNTPKEILGSVNTAFKYIAFGIYPLGIWLATYFQKLVAVNLIIAFSGFGFLLVGLLTAYLVGKEEVTIQ